MEKFEHCGTYRHSGSVYNEARQRRLVSESILIHNKIKLKFFYSDHFLVQIKKRRISKKLAKSIYLKVSERCFDVLTGHQIAINKRKHLGKMRSIMIVYDDIIENEIWFVTTYPLRNDEIINKVKSGRWALTNEKN